MRRTSALLAASKPKRSLRTLALNVHFKHPDLGMKQYEILSRATAFLLSVDPRDPDDDEVSNKKSTKASAYDHLGKNRQQREDFIRKQDYYRTPAGGKQRDVKNLNWLEFCPGEHRPLAHVVASSHVLSPWLWKNYYPQPWLDSVSQDHVAYSVAVYDAIQELEGNGNADDDDSGRIMKAEEPLATFALNPYPIHHPSQMDLALVHLKSEEGALKHMKSLGVEMLHLTDLERKYEKNDEVFFDGFQITEEHYEKVNNITSGTTSQQQNDDDDTRVFVPYKTSGNLIYASEDRFLASTSTPLPEGVCGGPVLDHAGDVCGIVEGIVPIDHEEKQMAGAASFIPSFRLKEFIDYAERIMLEQIVPKRLFDKVVSMKEEGKALNENAKPVMLDKEGGEEMDKLYREMVKNMKDAHTPEEVEAILGTVEREAKEVMEIFDKEGGELDEIIGRVRSETYKKRAEIMESLSKGEILEAEIVSETESSAKK